MLAGIVAHVETRRNNAAKASGLWPMDSSSSNSGPTGEKEYEPPDDQEILDEKAKKYEAHKRSISDECCQDMV